MALQVPEIDPRTYREILDEALARIRVHNPEWTNFNDSDPGITLLQLFAFMTESITYRSRLIPDRNRVKFLQLLGVELEPARAAEGIVAFDGTRGPLGVSILPDEMELLAGKIPFRTGNALAVLPVETRAYVKAPLPEDQEEELRAEYEVMYLGLQTGSVEFLLYETMPVEWSPSGTRSFDLGTSSVDGTLWLALMARGKDLVEATREAIANQVLTIGVVPEMRGDGMVLPEGGKRAPRSSESLAFELAIVDDSNPPVARYRPLQTSLSTDLLSEPGLAEIELPGRDELTVWEDLGPMDSGVGDLPPPLEGDDAARVVTWLRVRPVAGAAGTSARFIWVGANAATIGQRAHIAREVVGRGTGEPDQVLRVASTPVLPDSMAVTVDGEPWQRVDDLLDAGAEAPVGNAEPVSVGYGAEGVAVTNAYVVERDSGEIRFGNGIHGARPRAGSVIEATYDYGGGRMGVVGAGSVSKGPQLPAGMKVSNPIPTWGGDEATSLGEAERTVPSFLRTRDRAVAPDDFEDVAFATPGVDMGRVEVLPLVNPDLPEIESVGTVTVVVVPRFDAIYPETPVPDRFFLDLVCRHLDERRLVTTEVHVRGPDYVSVWVSVGFEAVPGRELAPVREAVKAEVRTYLSALEGGILGGGWPLSTNVERLELWAVVARVDGVAKVVDVLLTDDGGSALERVELSGLELPRLAAVSARQGSPESLADLRGEAGGADPTGVTFLPIPVEPGEC